MTLWAASRANADPAHDGRSALLRSAVCPGWGQLSAGSTVKGVVFVALTAALAYGHATSSSWSAGRRRELTRWTMLFWLFNLGDAYVDGYLRSFDAEMQEVESIGNDLLTGGVPAQQLQIGLGLRW